VRTLPSTLMRRCMTILVTSAPLRAYLRRFLRKINRGSDSRSLCGPVEGRGAKTPPNLSNIHALGAAKRFKCFLGPRAYKTKCTTPVLNLCLKCLQAIDCKQQTKTRSISFMHTHFQLNVHIFNDSTVCCVIFITFHWVFVCISRRWQRILFSFIFSALPSRTIREKGKEVDALSEHLTAAYSVATCVS